MGRPTDEERFWPKVEKTKDCWLWQGALFRSRYAAFRYDGQMRVAHRFAYRLLVGPIPEGLVLDHLCRNRACVRPDHLEPVTQHINMLRGVGWSGTNARKVSCKRGHEFTEENTIAVPASKRLPNGGRECRTCRREQNIRDNARRRQRKAAAK